MAMEVSAVKKPTVPAVFTETADGRVLKMEQDCSAKVDKVIPEAQKLAKAGQLDKALDLLYAIEKESRLSVDMRSNSRVQISIVKLCFESKQYGKLCENIVNLTKKRSLIKQAVTNMIQECCTYVDKTPDKETMLKLIETVRTVTEGKIYVELERARLTYKLTKMLEKEGKLDEACTLLLELQIETYGSMERQERVEILLEQMRLCLTRKDFVRAQIISRKISTKFFDDKTNKENQLLKLKYYELMIQLDQNDDNYLAICRHYLAVTNTEIIESDTAKLDQAMRNVVLFIVLAPFSNEQSDFMHRIQQNKHLERLPDFKNLLALFIRQELISWKDDILQKYEPILRPKKSSSSLKEQVFAKDTDIGKKQWEHFEVRVGEHNIRMVAKYYARIEMKRLAQLLGWTSEKTEEFLCQLIVGGTIEQAKIDRPDGIVTFRRRKLPNQTLDDWNYSTKSMMDKLSRACHLIAKEEMVHKHLHPVVTPVPVQSVI